MKTYRIGTRGSLLAVTQCTITKNELEKLTGDRFELVTIKTQGDEITNKPLWQLEGKDFFTKELDQALLNKEVDLVIHSYKDLGSVRPEGIKLAAITRRFFGHDIFLIKKEKAQQLVTGQLNKLIVGTSSPRRIVNLERFLPAFFPNNPHVKCEMLRGNVNTRVQKLRDDQYDAIVLAMAGLERLARFPSSKEQLEKLLDGMEYLVLPLSQFPAAAAQGALGVECLENRDDAGELEKKLALIHHLQTADEMKRERKAFASYGGGCHLAVGIHVRKQNDTFTHFHLGQVDGKDIQYQQLESNPKARWPIGIEPVFIGLPIQKKKELDAVILWDEAIEKLAIADSGNHQATGHHFVTSDYCFEMANQLRSQATGRWAAGVKTLKKLLHSGLWANGSADFLGHQQIREFQESELLKVFSKGAHPWFVLTSDSATSDLGKTIQCYKRQWKNPSESFKNALTTTNFFYWSSYPQYQLYLQHYPELASRAKIHFCGLGKTLEEFKVNGVEINPLLDPFISQANQ